MGLFFFRTEIFIELVIQGKELNIGTGCLNAENAIYNIDVTSEEKIQGSDEIVLILINNAPVIQNIDQVFLQPLFGTM
jgi:hypothetical protein